MGAGARLARAILQPQWTGGEIALEPRIARLTTDAGQGASRSDRQGFPQVIGDEWGLLVPG
jgi:hypothetical protein